jgi:hypothetical protein
VLPPARMPSYLLLATCYLLLSTFKYLKAYLLVGAVENLDTDA